MIKISQVNGARRQRQGSGRTGALPLRARRARRMTRDHWLGLLVLSPSLIAVGIFVYVFIGWSVYVSTIDWSGFVPDYTFKWLDNYWQVATDPRFLTDLRNLVLFSVVFIGQCIVIGFILAVLLNRHIKGEGIFRTIYILPFAVSLVVTGVSWHWLMDPTTGINLLLRAIGLGAIQPSWYLSQSWGIVAVATANSWQMCGYVMAIYLAGLRNIPTELVEAARMDGAGPFTIYRRVIIPLLAPVTVTALLLTGMVSVKTFDLVVTMTGGGPGFATDVLGLNMYQLAFQANLYSQSAAVAVIMMMIAGLVLVPYVMNNRRLKRTGLG